MTASGSVLATQEPGKRLPATSLEPAERELPVRDQPGDADADQAERSGPVAEAAVEQPAGELRDLLLVVDADVERGGAASDREVGVAELRRDGARRLAGAPEARGHLRRHPAQLVVEPLTVDEVALE